MLSSGKFRYVRGLYRNLAQRRKLNELFGEPITLADCNLTFTLHKPRTDSEPVVCSVIDHSTPESIPTHPLRIVTVFTEKGPTNVTYL